MMTSPQTMHEWYAAKMQDIPDEEVISQLSFIFSFLCESNKIEGEGPPGPGQILAAEHFLALDAPTVDDLCALVKSITSRGELRDQPGMDVRVGSHRPPPGSCAIRSELEGLLGMAYRRIRSPYDTHVAYETIHPFLDGNGRSGRLLWLWQMERQSPGGLQQLGFLHCWYYQSLEAARR